MRHRCRPEDLPRPGAQSQCTVCGMWTRNYVRTMKEIAARSANTLFDHVLEGYSTLRFKIPLFVLGCFLAVTASWHALLCDNKQSRAVICCGPCLVSVIFIFIHFYSKLMPKLENLDDGTGAGGNTGPQISALLSDGASDGRSLHLTLGVDNDTSVIYQVFNNIQSKVNTFQIALHR